MNAQETNPPGSENRRVDESTGESPGHRTRRPGRSWRLLLGALGLLVVAAAGLIYLLARGPGGVSLAPGPDAAAHPHDEKELYYCPMHPDYKSEEPGNCPICSMELVKLEKPTAGAGQPGSAAQAMPGMSMEMEPAAPLAAGIPSGNTLFIAPQRRQLIGVQSVPAEIKPLVKEIRTVGKVAYDETRVTHIHTKVTGYIEDVFVDFVGKVVHKGDPLFTLYSPDLVATQEEYLLALKSRPVFRDTSFSWIPNNTDNLVEATRQRLRLWDITDEQIQTLEREGRVRRALTIYSPVSGVATERAAYHHGRYIDPTMDLYTIVDLSMVWILADIYEYELPYAREGQTVAVEFPYASGAKVLRGKVAYLYPYLNPKTRTTQIRMEFANPDFTLRPDMFFNVQLRVDLGEQLAVPEDALLDTGTEQYVFVDRGEGYFEPRPVKVGAETDGYYAIASGLVAGERVVTAANFILDSESRLKGAFANMGAPSSPEMGQPAGMEQILSVEVRKPKEAKVGRNAMQLVVKDASGKPIEDAQVEVLLSMPQMGNMPPMSAQTNLQPMGEGEYTGEIDIPMAWTWETTVTVRKGSSVLGAVQTNITAR